MPYISPSSPILRGYPPTGPGWLHEVKFDGWRVQLHKRVLNRTPLIYSRNGADFTKRFPEIHVAVAALPCQSAIIDAELVACDLQGLPDFSALMRNGENPELCCWCFDLLELDGSDLRPLPLIERKSRLTALIHQADTQALRYSDHFTDAEALLAEVARRKMEGILSKKADQPYRSGKNPSWIKVKTGAWKEANASRHELFRDSKRRACP